LEQIERIQRMMKEFNDNLKSQFGDFESEVEVIDGRKKVILTDEEKKRYIMGFTLNDQGINLVAIPEGQELDPGLTQLERSYIETATQRAVHVLNNKFSERTGWDLSTLSATFERGAGIIIVGWEDGKVSVTEGDVDIGFNEEDE